MSDERSVRLFEATAEAQAKFDYFVCGVAGALFAYLGEHYTPRKLEWGVSAIEPLALVFLVVSFFVGLLRIDYCIRAARTNTVMLQAAESAGKLTTVIAKGGTGPFYNELSGDIESLKDIHERRDRRMAERDAHEGFAEGLRNKAATAWRWRNYFLMLGFVLILAAKILEPYSAHTTAAKASNSATNFLAQPVTNAATTNVLKK